MTSMKDPRVRVIVCVVALACIAFGVYLNFFYSRGFVKTTATIVEVRDSYGSEGDRTYYPTVEYIVDGKTYTGELNQGSSSYRVGKRIPVLYDPNDPDEVHATGGFEIYILVVGVAMLAFAIITTIKMKNNVQ